MKGFLASAFKADDSSLPEVLRINSEQPVAAADTSTGCPASQQVSKSAGHGWLAPDTFPRQRDTYVLSRLRWHVGLAFGSDASS